MGGHTVMHKQGVLVRAEHAALRVASVESQSGGSGIIIGIIIKDQIPCVESEISELDNDFGGDSCVEF